MKKYTVTVPDRDGQPQTLGILETDGAVTLGRFLSDGTRADIPSEIGGMPVTVIGDDCFFGRDKLTEITLPDTVTEIGAQAFAMCKALREVILPDSVTELGTYAFRDCKSLRRVRLSPNLKRLRSGTFAFCNLTGAELIIPEGLETVEAHAFYSSGGFTLHLPESVREIQRGALVMGPEVQTALPYDKGWFMDFPYGETLLFSDGKSALVTDYDSAGKGCLILQIDCGGTQQRCFYPCADGSYTFSDQKSQKRMERMAAEIPELRSQFELFANGYL